MRKPSGVFLSFSKSLSLLKWVTYKSEIKVKSPFVSHFDSYSKFI